ncbi:toll/interleukin-1 receptor domain-containing protein [Tardiphaga sp.]|jgi:hypothetical protein|uniref:toll/interleukin-1 receptor domain-containing protein n=1 Tax=Tardiphaga sp. TaxID=1926292 RepID=UPI0037D9CEC6
MRCDGDTTIDAPKQATSAVSRRLIFISHATPQDNTFATWLATQLAIAGYEVWCDTTKLLGGEGWWDDISEAIDMHAARFLFVSTLEANRKGGTLRELRLALEAQEKHKLKDFVVPLKIDAFPFAAMQKPLPDLNAVRFEENWAVGLSRLLKLLEREGIPRSPSAGPACVTEWYGRSLDRRRKPIVTNERCHSNWFQIALPKDLHFFTFGFSSNALDKQASGFKFAYRIVGSTFLSFAGPTEMQDHFGPAINLPRPVIVDTATFLEDGSKDYNIAAFDAANMVTDLVRQTWEGSLDARKLGTHILGSGLAARYFTAGQLTKNRAYFTAFGRRRTYRQLVGNKSKRAKDGTKVPDGNWHYALSCSPQLLPFPRLVLRHHVIFTDDGITPWAKPERMHKARRSVCKQWWNGEWRDRLFAFIAELGHSKTKLALDVGGDQVLTVTMLPMNFTSPVSYLENADDGLDETTEIELVEDEDPEDEDDETA